MAGPRLSARGADFVYIEYEHSFMNEADLASFVLACRLAELPVVAKVPECSRTHVAKLLECGVIGIQLPWTESREQIDRLVSYVKFPPVGIRAAAPGMGNCDYNLQTTGRELIETGNRETVVLAHVETRKGIENLDAILGQPARGRPLPGHVRPLDQLRPAGRVQPSGRRRRRGNGPRRRQDSTAKSPACTCPTPRPPNPGSPAACVSSKRPAKWT